MPSVLCFYCDNGTVPHHAFSSIVLSPSLCLLFYGSAVVVGKSLILLSVLWFCCGSGKVLGGYLQFKVHRQEHMIDCTSR